MTSTLFNSFLGIMTEKEIEEKRQLVMANRQKRAAQSWKPSVFSAEQQEILKKLTLSFIDANVLPDGKIIRVRSHLLRLRDFCCCF